MRLKMLMWKDYRQQKRFLAAALLMLLAPYLVAAIVFAVARFVERPTMTWFDAIRVASLSDFVIGIVLFGFFPANAIAGERADGGAEFFAYLPIRRAEAALSKAAVSLALSTSVLAVCVGLAFISFRIGPNEPGPSWDEWYVVFATCIVMFGAAWMVSSFASSATYAAAAGFAVTFGFVVAFVWLFAQPVTSETRSVAMYTIPCMIFGPVAFAVGVWHYVRRVEP